MPDSFLMPGGLGGVSSIFDTDEMRQRRMWDALSGMAQGLLASSGPSPYPRGFMDTLGAGVQGALAGIGNEDKYLKRALTSAQLKKTQSELEADKMLTNAFLTAGQNPAAVSPSAAPSAQSTSAPGDMAQYKKAIAGIESAGNANPYSAIGPVSVVKGKPSKPYGKYQVMDFNIGPWTQEVLGQAMTPEQFLASPEAQERVFEVKFGQSLQKYGNPQDAASVWFSGQPLAGNTAGPDVNQTTVGGYVNKFNRGMYGGQGNTPDVQTAQPPTPQVMQGGGDAPTPQVVPVQYTPPQAAPRTLPDIIATIPPAVRQGALLLDRKGKLDLLMKYADPETVPAIDRNGQIVFAPKHLLSSGAYQPIDAQRLANEGARLQMDREKFTYEQKKDASAQEREERKFGTEQTKFKTETEDKLRDDFDKSSVVKSYRVVVPMLESAKDAAGRPTRAADLNLIYAFAKLMDPESVVRESETGMVTASGTVADRLGGYIGQLNGQPMLRPETRQKLIDELQSRFKSLEASYLATENAYKGIAENRGLNFDNIRTPIRSPGARQGDNTPTTEELNRWATGAPSPQTPQYKYVPGKGLVKQ